MINEQYILNFDNFIFEQELIKDEKFVPTMYKGIHGWFNYPDFYNEIAEELKDGMRIAEVGTWLGKSTCYLAEIIKNKGLKIVIDAIDLFDGPEKTHHTDEIKDEGGLLSFFKTNMKNAGVSSYVNPIKSDSASYAENYDNNSMDFIFIDALHTYEGVKRDIEAYWPKVKKGGILSGHDYGSSHAGVVKAVDEFFSNLKIPVTKKSKTVWFVRK
jgi:hypothetical protein